MKSTLVAAALALICAVPADAQEYPKDRKDAAYNAGQAAGMLQWAVENCGGKISPQANVAFELGHTLDNDVFFTSGAVAYRKMLDTAKEVGRDSQCTMFIVLYGPEGTTAKGAYIPPKGQRK